MNRRNFIKTTAAAGTAALIIPEIVRAAMPEVSEDKPKKSNDVLQPVRSILFQGDSITDAGRDRKQEDKPSNMAALGNGYPLFASAALLAKLPTRVLQIYNRGISGDKVAQLSARWEKDCIGIKPDLLSILIGVNDFWRTRSDKTYKGTIDSYLTEYRKLLNDTVAALPDTRLVVCEPFIIHGGSALDETWEPIFAGYRSAAAMLADEFKAVFVPFQKVFNKALEKVPASYWGADGVHPSMAGAQLMAETWVKTVEFELGVRSASAFKNHFFY